MATVVEATHSNDVWKLKDPAFIYTGENYTMYDKPRVEDNKGLFETRSTPEYDNIPKPFVASDDYYEKFLDTESKIYGINHTIFGQAILALDNCILTPEPIPYFNNMRITSVSTGTFHTTFLNSMGMVYNIGHSTGFNRIIGGTPKLIEFFKDIPIASISCGNYDTIFLDTYGKAYGLSYNEEAILGHGLRSTRWLGTPTFFDNIFQTVGVTRGLLHTLYIDNVDRVYGVGYNDEGQLGIDIDTALMNTPWPIAYFHNIPISSVTAGANHTIFIDKSGNPYSVGNNEYGQLGIQNINIKNVKIPEHITYFKDIQIMSGSAGSFHTILLDTKGKVYAFGSNEYGQLGITLDDAMVPTPEPITYFNDIPIKSVSAGATHTIFLDTQGKVYSTGDNKFGQLGLGDKKNRIFPEPIRYFDNIKISSISAGGTHTIFIDTTGKVYAVGYNEKEQLGISNVKGNHEADEDVEVVRDIEDIEIYWKVAGEWWIMP